VTPPALDHCTTQEAKIEGQVSHLEETWHHPYGEAWWFAASCFGDFFSLAEYGRPLRIEGKMNGAYYREILNENLLQSAQDLRLG
jgi:hypothetical protein